MGQSQERERERGRERGGREKKDDDQRIHRRTRASRSWVVVVD